MNPERTPLTRHELIEFVNSMSGEVVRLRMEIEQLKEKLSLSEGLVNLNQEQIRYLTDEARIKLYGP